MSDFDRLRRQDIRNEIRIFRSEVAIVVATALLVAAYIMIS